MRTSDSRWLDGVDTSRPSEPRCGEADAEIFAKPCVMKTKRAAPLATNMEQTRPRSFTACAAADRFDRAAKFFSRDARRVRETPGDKGVTDVEARGYANMLKFVALPRAGATIVVGSHFVGAEAERAGLISGRIARECDDAREVISGDLTARFFHADRASAASTNKLADSFY